MDQMEHNVKIKDYSRKLNPDALAYYTHSLNYPQNYPCQQEQARLLERFQHVHWNRNSVLAFPSHEHRMAILSDQYYQEEEFQKSMRKDVERHRLQHLEGIKQNIQEERDRFARKVNLARPGAVAEQLGDKPLYKIINDGLPIKY